MSADVRLLLWPRWRALRNTARRAGRGSTLRLLVFGLLGAGFMVGGFAGALWLFERFQQAEFLAELLVQRTLGLVLLFFSGLLVFSSTVTAFSTLYLADDLQLLVSAPVRVGRLYFARLVETWLSSSWMMLVFALPIIAGAGPALGAPTWFYLALPLVLLPLTIVCAALGTIIAMLLARVLPARRTQDVLVVLAMVAFLVAYVAVRLAEPEKLLDPTGFDRLVSLVGGLQPGRAFLPPDWAVHVLFAFVRGEPDTAWLPLLVLGSAAPACCALGAWTARAVYLHSYSLAQEGRDEGSRVARLVALLRPRRRRGLPRYPRSPVAALVQRDARIFFRTTSQWTQLLLIGALIVVYVFNFKHFRSLQDTGLLGPGVLFFANVVLGGFVTTTLAARFLFPAVSLEGRARWVVSTAPITHRALLRAKVRFGLWPLLVVCEALVLGSSALLDQSPVATAVAAALVALMTWAIAGMAVGLGATDPQYDVDNPARIASGVGGVVFMLLGLLYLVVTVVMLASPVSALLFGLQTGYVPRPVRLVYFGALVLGAIALAAVAHRVPLWLGERALGRREER